MSIREKEKLIRIIEIVSTHIIHEENKYLDDGETEMAKYLRGQSVALEGVMDYLKTGNTGLLTEWLGSRGKILIEDIKEGKVKI